MRFFKSCSPATLKAYSRDLKELLVFENTDEVPNKLSSNREIITLDEQILEKIKKAMLVWSKTVSRRSQNRKVAVARSFLKWLCHIEKRVSSDFSSHLVFGKFEAKLPNYLSVDEVLAVIQSIENQERENRDNDLSLKREKVLFLLLYGGGLRISEALSLLWKNIDPKEGRVLVLGKGNKERWVPQPPLVFRELSLLAHLSGNEDAKVECQPSQFVFGSPPLSPQKGYWMIQRCGKRAGLLKPIHPHMLRHSFATHMLTSGANLRVIQEIMGHASLVTTEKYMHLNIDDIAAKLEQFHPITKLSTR